MGTIIVLNYPFPWVQFCHLLFLKTSLMLFTIILLSYHLSYSIPCAHDISLSSVPVVCKETIASYRL